MSHITNADTLSRRLIVGTRSLHGNTTQGFCQSAWITNSFFMQSSQTGLKYLNQSENKIWYRVSDCLSINVEQLSDFVFLHGWRQNWQHGADRTSGSRRRLVGHFNVTEAPRGRPGRKHKLPRQPSTQHHVPLLTCREDPQFPHCWVQVTLPDFTL